jgi:mRNA-degrading endonuclease YafQ of YafQ-DinJ toxin-antitoxin module
MNIEFRQTFIKDLRKLENRQIKQQIQSVIEAIETANNLTELKNIKAIQNKVRTPRKFPHPLPLSLGRGVKCLNINA